VFKKTLSFFVSCLLIASAAVAAKEPVNLAVIKHKLERYHDSGEYLHDISDVATKALRYLELRVERGDFKGKKPAIVLDIDETSLSNYPDMVRLDFGGTIEEIRQDEDKGTDEAIEPTLKLYRYAKAHHIAVFFITGRHEEERQVTEENLQKAGYLNHDGLILRSGDYKKAPASVYKTAMRNQLIEKGYDIILNMGDQQSDLRGGYADKTFKLPNPYYLIP
jgi:predicted secreted acid phosphatase